MEVEGVRVLDGALGNREPLHPVRQGRMVAQHDRLGVARPRKDLPPVERPFILPRMGIVLQQLWVQIRSPCDDGTDAKECQCKGSRHFSLALLSLPLVRGG